MVEKVESNVMIVQKSENIVVQEVGVQTKQTWGRMSWKKNMMRGLFFLQVLRFLKIKQTTYRNQVNYTEHL